HDGAAPLQAPDAQGVAEGAEGRRERRGRRGLQEGRRGLGRGPEDRHLQGRHLHGEEVMKRALKWLVAAAAIHAVLLLFGGLLLFKKPQARVVSESVELIDDSAAQKKDEKKVEPEKKVQEAPIEQSDEPMPEMKDLAQLESPVNAPALAPLSLSDLSGMLDGAGGGDFGTGGGGLSSGGRIGGTGTGVGLDEDAMGEVASIGDLD